MPHVTLRNGTRFDAERGVTLLDAAIGRGLALEHSCRTGRCGSCKARVAAGTAAPLRAQTALSRDELAQGWVLTCTHEATSDIALDIEDLGQLAGLSPRIVPTRIDRLELLAPDVLRVVLRLPPTAGFRFLAGQSIALTSPAGVVRSYSIASAASAPAALELHVRRVDDGRFSAWWFDEARVGDLLRFHGPLGTFFLRSTDGLDLVFLATGTGIAPIRAMLMQLAQAPAGERPRSVALYWGGRGAQDHYIDPRPMLDGLRYVPVLSRAAVPIGGAQGHVQEALMRDVVRGAAPGWGTMAVYACGSEAMIEDARRTLAGAGLPAGRFHSDAFVSSEPNASATPQAEQQP